MQPNIRKLFVAGAILASCAGGAMAQPFGQWDFSTGTLDQTIGSYPLTYVDGLAGATHAGTRFGSTATFGIPPINGTNANVMQFPASDSTMGYFMHNPAVANGGGSIVNSYTLVFDLLFPASADGRVRPLAMTDDGIYTPDADLVVDSNNGIGAPAGPYAGTILPNTWNRVAFSVTSSEIREYINGLEVGVQANNSGLDGQLALSLGGLAQLFANSTLDGASSGYVSSLQLWDVPLSAGQIAALGAASATKIPTNITLVPSFLASRSPAVNATGASPQPTVQAVVNPGSTVVDPASFVLSLDGVVLASTVSAANNNFTVAGTVTTLLAPLATHTATLVYSDSVDGLKTNQWNFIVAQYQNISLPTPIYLETFDAVSEGGVPAGWVATNWTDTINAVLDLNDTGSDSYKDWVVIDRDHYAAVYSDAGTYTTPGFPPVTGNRRQVLPPIVENGVLLDNLISGNLLVAESDQRGGSQVQVITTSDYDFTGKQNIYVSFHNINEINQDNMCGVEYSIDQGKTWLPLLYMFDDGTTDRDGSDVVTNQFTGVLDAVATFNTARNDQAHAKSFGTYIGAAINAGLAPYLRGCRNDDPLNQKRVELFGMPLAANQAAVRLRFVQAGTGSWYFGIDNLGFYSIDRPVVLLQPGNVVADFNGPAQLNVTAGGTQLTYQWQKDGRDITGATNAVYLIANTSTNSPGIYRVAITNASGFAISDEVSLSLLYTPVVLTAPQEQTVTIGTPASFSVTARGGRPLSYQWLLNSNVVAGATGSVYSISSAANNQAGYYQVLISNVFSTVLSPAAKLTVFSGDIKQDMVVHLTFDNSYADTSGRGNNSTNVGSPTFTNGFLGQAIHLTTSGSPANAPATNNYVTLNYPSDLKLGSDLTGDAANFSVSFWTKIFYQNDDQAFIGNKNWDSGGNPGWVINTQGDGMKWNYRDNAINNVPGVGNTRRDSPHVAPELEDGTWHHVVVTMARHSVGKIYVDGVLKNTSALGTDSLTNLVGSVDTDGIGWSVNIGQDGTGRYTDGGGNSAVDMLMDDVAIWRRVVTDLEVVGVFNAGLRSNSVEKATISTPGSAPTVTAQPASKVIDAGVDASFKVAVLGTPSIGYQWYFGANALLGQTNKSLLITNGTAASQGNYFVVITNGFGSVTSLVATLTVNSAPNISGQPASQTVLAGNTANFTVTASGASPITYQWFKGSAPLADQTNANLLIVNAQGVDQASYKVIVANSLGSATSSVAVLTVITTPVITVQPAPKIVSPGATNVSFQVAVTSPGVPTYEWLKNGVVIPGATANPLVLSLVAPSDDANYSVIVSNAYGTVTSASARLTVFTGSIGQNVVAYLPFDGDYNDYSGLRNHGIPKGSPSFSPGRVGQSLHFQTTADGVIRNYVSLGYPDSLKFGVNSFSVSIWVNYTNQVDDPSLISNKDWNSSSNIGWGLFTQNGGNFRVNVTGTPRGSGNKYDTTFSQIIRDGKWHQVVCTFWRGQTVSTYVDGVLVNTKAFNITGSVDTDSVGFSINIGQDGTGTYTDGGSAAVEGDIDEVVLWNRVVTEQEVALLYNAGVNGASLLPFVTSVTQSAGSVTVNWKGGLPPFTVETKASLNDAVWTPVATSSSQSATIPVGVGGGFIRVIGQTK